MDQYDEYILTVTGTTIEKLCAYAYSEGIDGQAAVPRAVSDKAAMVRAARCLLAAITRVLLLADSVVVKQLLLAKDKVGHITLSFSSFFLSLPLFITRL